MLLKYLLWTQWNNRSANYFHISDHSGITEVQKFTILLWVYMEKIVVNIFLNLKRVQWDKNVHNITSFNSYTMCILKLFSTAPIDSCL